MLFGGEGRLGAGMEVVHHRLPGFGRLAEGLRLEDGGLLIAVDDVVHPTAQGIDGVDGPSLVGLEGAERRVEGG